MSPTLLIIPGLIGRNDFTWCPDSRTGTPQAARAPRRQAGGGTRRLSRSCREVPDPWPGIWWDYGSGNAP